jgi:hypothetical protein
MARCTQVHGNLSVDLARVAEAWPRLPAGVKAAILAAVDATGCDLAGLNGDAAEGPTGTSYAFLRVESARRHAGR